MISKKQKIGKMLIIMITAISVIGVFFIDPIKQVLSYHQFVDNKTVFGIPHFWNVVSNIPFLVIGIYALIFFRKMEIIAEMGVAYWLFFFGVALVAFGSGYYHYSPSNHSLVWDRLPMTVAFMSLFSIIISEFINERQGALLLIPFTCLGIFSVFYWQWTELHGVGDLRFYVLVQFVPIVLIPIILIFYPGKFNSNSGYWLLLLAYLIAKFLEYFDASIYHFFGGFISGHPLKHVAAAVGVMFLFQYYKSRVRI